MTNSLNISAYIYDKLSDISGIKTYPIIADNDAKFPFIVYKRNDMSPLSSKDGLHGDEVSEEITIITDKYSTGVTLAQQVRKILERDDIYTDSTGIMRISTILSSASEDYQNNTYIQKLLFSIKIHK